MNNNSNLSVSRLASAPDFSRVPSEIPRAEQYWAEDALESGTFGTNTPFPWSIAQGRVFRTDSSDHGNLHWDGHSGPVTFYADTIVNPQHAEARGNGWARSLELNLSFDEPVIPVFGGIDGRPLAVPSNGKFEFEVRSSASSVTIQTSTDLLNWMDAIVQNVADGKAVVSDSTAERTKFYRLKPAL